MIDFIAHQADLRFLLEEVPQALIEVAMNGLDSLERPPGLCTHHSEQVATLIGVIVLLDIEDA